MAPAAKRRKIKAAEPPKGTETHKAVEKTEPKQLTNTAMDLAEEPKYPGFTSWNTTLEMSDGSTSKFDNDKAEFAQSAKIYDPNAFTLKPLTVAQGPLKGRRVLMLEPVNIVFRFMDLPAEVRVIVYEMLLKEEGDVALRLLRRREQKSRAVRTTFRHAHEGLTWDAKKTKWWPPQPPTAHALLRVSRELQAETAPVAYGDNGFSFNDLQAMKAFLEDIGDMRQYLRKIVLTESFLPNTLVRPTLHKLKDAKHLRSLTLSHRQACNSSKGSNAGNCRQLVEYYRPLMKALYKAWRSRDDTVNVLDIIELTPDISDLDRACQAGRNGKDCSCRIWLPYRCSGEMQGIMCRKALQHCNEIQSEFRKALADDLGIKDESGKT